MSKNPIITFLNNIRYLFRYNIKEMYRRQSHFQPAQPLTLEQILALTQKIKYETKGDWDNIVIPKTKNPMETCLELANSEKSIIRCADGEFMLMEGKDIPFQKYHPDLAEKLKKIFKTNDPNLMIGGPTEYHMPPDHLRRYVAEWMYLSGGDIYARLKDLYNPDTTYYAGGISQIFATRENYDYEKHFNLLRQIWNNKKITVLTGDWIQDKIEHNVFDNAASINYIYGPSKDAYDEYENLKAQMEKVDKDNILIFAIGPAGKAIAYDLYNMGYRVLDMGHTIKDYDAYKKQLEMDTDGGFKFFAPDA